MKMPRPESKYGVCVGISYLASLSRSVLEVFLSSPKRTLHSERTQRSTMQAINT